MKVRYLIEHNTPYRYVPAGTVTDCDDAEQLIKDGIVEEAPAASSPVKRKKGGKRASHR